MGFNLGNLTAYTQENTDLLASAVKFPKLKPILI